MTIDGNLKDHFQLRNPPTSYAMHAQANFLIVSSEAPSLSIHEAHDLLQSSPPLPSCHRASNCTILFRNSISPQLLNSQHPTSQLKRSIPFCPLLIQHPMTAILAAYWIAFLQVHFGIAFAAGILRCGLGECGSCGGEGRSDVCFSGHDG